MLLAFPFFRIGLLIRAAIKMPPEEPFGGLRYLSNHTLKSATFLRCPPPSQIGNNFDHADLYIEANLRAR
jgi:hypothetical protein